MDCCWLDVEKQARWESVGAPFEFEFRAPFGKTERDGRVDGRARTLGVIFFMVSARMRDIKMMVNQSQLCTRNWLLRCGR